MTNLVQTFELYLERKINETIDAYFEANPRNSELDEDRVKELAREEANDAIDNADYDIDIRVSA